jgi:hypothetical protein
MSATCQRLHEIFRTGERHSFPYDSDAIPLNGIYLLYEAGELSHQGDRIVCVGSHTGDDRLRSRLEEHFVKENKDRSIFRRNIGRALLSADNDPFIDDWNVSLTKRKDRERYAGRIDKAKLARVEQQVTSYIRKSFSFVAMPIADKKERLSVKSKIISTLSWCEECKPSAKWLGGYSPLDKIQHSGLWLVQGLYKEPLTNEELDYLEAISN